MKTNTCRGYIYQSVKDGKKVPKKWRIVIYRGVNVITGKQDKYTEVLNGTKREAEKRKNQLISDFSSGLEVKGGEMSFYEFSTKFHQLRVDSSKYTKSTMIRENTIINLLNSYIGNVSLDDITPLLVETLYDQIRKDKTKELGSYSETTLKMYHQKLKMIMDKAVDYDLILRNPCNRVSEPKVDNPERKSLVVTDAQRLLSCISEDEEKAYQEMKEKEERYEKSKIYYEGKDRSYLRGLSNIGYLIAVRIGLATGMRRGEVFGLTWDSIDLDNGVINVNKSLSYEEGIKKTKTRASVRTISIDQETIAHLRIWKDRQSEELSKLHIDQSGETAVCCSVFGSFIDLHNFERWWRKWRSEKGFEGLKFHELRHTQATQLLGHGVDVKTVQTRLGHSNASTTLNWYAHALEHNDRRAAMVLGNLFQENTNQNTKQMAV